MKKLRLFLIFSFVLGLAKVIALDDDRLWYEEISSQFFETRVEVGYSFGQLIGMRQGYTELGLFVPSLATSSLISFIDCRGYRFLNSKWGSSSGIGLRKSLDKYIIGGNLYYDYLEGHTHKPLHRLGVGLEWLGDSWDLRLNTYFPLGKQSYSSKTVSYVDPARNYFITSYEKQCCIAKGFDAEIGGYLFCWNRFAFYGAAGPYYYSSKQKMHYFGVQARAEISYNTLLSIHVKTSYDSVNRSRTLGQIQISIPFDVLCKTLTCLCENLALQPVKRNGVIFTDKCYDYKWNW